MCHLQNRSPQLEPQLLDFALDVHAALALVVDLLGIGSRILELELKDIVLRFTGSIKGHFRVSTAFAKNH